MMASPTGNRGSDREQVLLTVPSHPKYLYVVRSAVYPVLIDAGFSRKEARTIVLALDEACSNIIRHAYEGDPGGTISLSVTVEAGELRFELSDTGKKVDISLIAPRRLEDVRPGGLGTHFINTVFDFVQYDTNRPRGTVLTLVKKRAVRPPV
jgi:anti-sigma regulatory factor (Ser/Thr protein kinase)